MHAHRESMISQCDGDDGDDASEYPASSVSDGHAFLTRWGKACITSSMTGIVRHGEQTIKHSRPVRNNGSG